MLRVVEAAADGLPGKTPAARRKLAWTVLAALSGGVTFARAADDPKVGAQIAGRAQGDDRRADRRGGMNHRRASRTCQADEPALRGAHPAERERAPTAAR